MDILFRFQFTGINSRGKTVTKRLSAAASHWAEAIDVANAQHRLDALYTCRRYDFNDPVRVSALAVRIARNAGPEEA